MKSDLLFFKVKINLLFFNFKNITKYINHFFFIHKIIIKKAKKEMYKINISNRIIENRYEMYINDVIFHNLLFMKPTIDSQCPDSFKFKLKNSHSVKNGI